MNLAPYAASDASTRGRIYPEEKPSHRSEYQRDRDRIIHSSAFRRLEYKTQVFVNHEGDMFRTRLTHSIEVAQIGRTIARALSVNEDLTEAICLAHDVGHTPFGHAGQDELNQCMKDHGGFEHNFQSLRVIDELEEKYARFSGLNLTFETREGILKHCSRNNARNIGELGLRFLHNKQPGIEAQIANIADEIAYNNHDVDDGLRSGLITIEQLMSCKMFAKHYNIVTREYPDISNKCLQHEIIRRMVNYLVADLIKTSGDNIAAVKPISIDDVREHNKSLVTLSTEAAAHNLELKQFLRDNLYHHHYVHRMTTRARYILRTLFNEFISDIRLLPIEQRHRITELEGRGVESAKQRVIADYIAGMTDRFAIAECERTLNPSKNYTC